MSDVTLHLGDCLEVMRSMPDKSVDCIFADPPFNANKNYKCDFNDNKPIEEYREWMGDCIGEMSRIIKPGGFIWLMQDQRNVGFCMMLLEKYGLDFRNIVHPKKYAPYQPPKMGLGQNGNRHQ